MTKKIFVSGCFDMLHSGHVAFFEEASKYGDLYVGIGSDNTVLTLKGRKTINTEQERLYMVNSLKSVRNAFINTGSGLLDFENELINLRPDIFFVNEDGASPEKEKLCKKLNIQYIIGRRIPHEQLPARSTTALRQECRIPYRIDLAGGWLDQPFVSKYCPGSVITICIEPDYEFNDRSGMATSSRKKAIEMWHTDIPHGNPEILAKTLFGFENPPGTKIISGSQDSIGIVYPGLNKLDYNNNYWPYNITSVLDSQILNWIEDHIFLVPLSPRNSNYDVLSNTNINHPNANDLSIASQNTWEAIISKNLQKFAESFTNSFNAQIKMFPDMVNSDIMQTLNTFKNRVLGWKLSGAGGGGYFVFIADKLLDNGMKIKIRRDIS